MDQLAADGWVSQDHVERMKALVRGNEELAMIDSGGGMIHGEPADWDQAIAKFPRTEFLFYHINPSKLDTAKYQVARPGWGKTFIPERQFPQSVFSGVTQALKLFQVKDLSWLNILLSQGNVVEMPAGSEVVKKGTEGDHFYFILSGTLDVLDPANDREPLLATLEGGDFFGEMSIINKSKTNATVLAKTPVILFRLAGDLFLEFVEKNELRESFASLWKRRPLISSVAIFRDLDPTAKHEISLLARNRVFTKDEVVFRQGSKTEDFFIISSGRVGISRKNDHGKILLETDKRNATATALTEVSTLIISSIELRELAKRMPILRHQLHLIMKKRGIPEEILERSVISIE
jgi:CRP-like cAMP-binding protein